MAKDDDNKAVNKDSFSVSVAPEMQLYHVLHHLNYGIETAFAEFVDNSIQSFLDNEEKIKVKGAPKEVTEKELTVTISVDTKKNVIVIEDNASGIDRTTMQRALRLGNNVLDFHPEDSLSVYGIGMKSSAIWFSKNWKIETSALEDNEKLHFNFNLNELIKNQKTEADVSASNEKANKHYTRITLNNHVRSESKVYYEDTVLPFLLETFGNFLNKLDIVIKYDGKEISPNPKKVTRGVPEVLVYPPVNKKGVISKDALVKWTLPINFKYKGREVTGFVMLREVGSYTQPGLRLLRNNRVIEGTTVYPNIPSVLLGTKNKYGAQRIYGELDISSFPVDFMKTNFNENLKGFYQALSKQISDNHIGSLVDQATYFRKNLMDKEPNKGLYKSASKRALVIDLEDQDNEGIRDIDSSFVEPYPGPGPAPATAPAPEPETENGEEKGKDSDQNDTNNENEDKSGGGGSKFPTPHPDNRMEKSQELEEAMKLLKEDKLISLYDSLCTVSLRQHSVMCYVSAWCLLEAITARLGRKDGNDFVSFIGNKINIYCPKDRILKKELKQVVQDISTKGNCTKHSGRYWNRDALDLKDHFKILVPLLEWMIEDSVLSEESQEP